MNITLVLALNFHRFGGWLASELAFRGWRYVLLMRGMLTLGAIFAVASSTAGSVQAQQTLPSTVEPGQVEKRIQTQPPKSETADPIGVQPDRPARSDVAADLRFTLTGVVFDGVTVYPSADFARHYEPYLAKEISLVEVNAILDAVTRHYREDGYILSRAVALPQPLDLGVLRVSVIEGYVDRVVFDGDSPGRSGLLHGFAGNITAARPGRLSVLERNLLLINDLPGLDAKARLRPLDEDAGAYEMVIALSHDDADGAIYLDNRGTSSVGSAQGLASVGFNSAFQLLERTQVDLFTVPGEPDELVFVGLQQQVPAGAWGTRVFATGSYSKIDAGGGLRRFDLESASTRVTAGIRHPFVRTRNASLFAFATADFANFDQDAGADSLFDDRLRVARFGVDMFVDDRLRGSNYIRLEGSRGFDILDASDSGRDSLSRADGRVEFSKLATRASRLQRLSDNWFVQVSLFSQVASDPLLSAEEFGLGGGQIGRAFDPSEITDDNGGAVSLELRYEGSVDGEVVDHYRLYGFADIGAVWPHRGSFSSDREALASAGAGMQIGFGSAFYANLEIAKPLNRKPIEEESRAPRLFVALSLEF